MSTCVTILPLHIRKEHSLWICKVTVEAGICPYDHVLFNEPGVGLTRFACACYRITQCHCSFPHTLQYRDILIPFFAWLVCQFTRAEGPWLNFPPRRMLGLSFVCTFASRMEVLLFPSVCEHMPECDLRCAVCSWVCEEAVATLWWKALKKIVLMWPLSLTTAR